MNDTVVNNVDKLNPIVSTRELSKKDKLDNEDIIDL